MQRHLEGILSAICIAITTGRRSRNSTTGKPGLSMHYVTFLSTFRFTSFNVKLGVFVLLCFMGFLNLLFLFKVFLIKFHTSYPCSMLL